jgi:hypothetical protein
MKNNNRIHNIISKLPLLTSGQIYWIGKVIEVFEGEHLFRLIDSDILDQETINTFGDALRVHHTLP